MIQPYLVWYEQLVVSNANITSITLYIILLIIPVNCVHSCLLFCKSYIVSL